MPKTKPQVEKRTIDLGVKVSATEEKIILEKAKLLQMNKSQFVRFVCLNAKVSLSV